MKHVLRETILNQRLALQPHEVEAYSRSLIQKIKQHPLYQKAKVVGLFSAIKHEPDLSPLLKDSKIWLLPKVSGDNLIYVRYQSQSSLIKSELGILEPLGLKDESSNLDLVIIPGIAFDTKGNRIGFGKGYFDRFLSSHQPPYVIGVAYPFQMQKQIKTTKSDVPVNEVLVA
jgi:5-formyltetrahydrofolate cyclo-ligase